MLANILQTRNSVTAATVCKLNGRYAMCMVEKANSASLTTLSGFMHTVKPQRQSDLHVM